jgi:hypothetical protein
MGLLNFPAYRITFLRGKSKLLNFLLDNCQYEKYTTFKGYFNPYGVIMKTRTSKRTARAKHKAPVRHKKNIFQKMLTAEGWRRLMMGGRKAKRK